jgi:hypothetical protein
MGGVDVVLGVQWLQSLGTMALNFQDHFMRFSSEGKEIDIRGIQGKTSKVIISKIMIELLKRGKHGVIAHLSSTDVQTTISSVPMDIKKVINNDSYLRRCLRVFHLLNIMPMIFIDNNEVYIYSSMFLS